MTLAKPLLLAALILSIPIVPFLLFGERLEQRIGDWLSEGASPGILGMAIVGILASDILLPVPSSLVSTYGGAQLSLPWAVGASFLGLTLGAAVGFGLARRLGRPWAQKWAGDGNAFDRLAQRHGVLTLVLCRAAPVLAEASVLAMGVGGLSWRRFWPPVALANLGIAAAYSLLGRWGKEQSELPYVLLASVVVPAAASLLARAAFFRTGVHSESP